ncbi:MAG: PEP/pyruvate-binding domain-containing protein [Desulfuromonadales bacterium]|jgi:pyruvate,water dikinase
MNYLVDLSSSCDKSSPAIGGKAAMLGVLQQKGFTVPSGYCLPVNVYHEFLHQTGLDRFISMELQRKDFAAMRWEEIWDVSLRIRNHFVTRVWPQQIKQKLLEDIRSFSTRWPATAVRSTAPGEDAKSQSFAGLHESRVMLRDSTAILEAIRTVWASLWSDGALLYRHELGLDPGKSGMAVILQEMVVGEVSGVLFTRAPQDRKVMMAEAVWGLNQALVDGTIEPDRWQLDRATGKVIERHEVKHTAAMRPAIYGVALQPLGEPERQESPLNESRCQQLHQVGCELEELLGAAVDLEWTFSGDQLYILQARPVTATLSAQANDDRPWYLSLHRSLENLEELQAELEQKVLPGMDRDAQQMALSNLTALENRELAEEYVRRTGILNRWLQVYKEQCIPMAHGLRLFGEFYNDLVKPEDPYEFVSLLHSDDLLAVQRNRQLNKLAAILRDNPALLKQLQEHQVIAPAHPFRAMLDDFAEHYSGMNWVLQGGLDLHGWLIKLAEEKNGFCDSASESKENAFLQTLDSAEREFAALMLQVARASYLLRDNDNLYLGKVRAGVTAAEQEIRKRLAAGAGQGLENLLPEKASPNRLFSRDESPQDDRSTSTVQQRPRQLVGQPAGPGVSSGLARVLDDSNTLADFKRGEVLVCDAIEPNMTFLAPLAAAIIERRGGMLIHGAIIAREYGIPCVTGIPDATRVIQTGDHLSIDGYLGIVTIDRDEQ